MPTGGSNQDDKKTANDDTATNRNISIASISTNSLDAVVAETLMRKNMKTTIMTTTTTTKARNNRRSIDKVSEDHVRLVRLVGSRPWLYDKSNENYGKKLLVDNSWTEIARLMSESVPACKDRWRNIRAAFARSIDVYKTTTGPNRLKPYYLSSELAFLERCMTKGLKSFNDSSSNGAEMDHMIVEQNSGDASPSLFKKPDEKLHEIESQPTLTSVKTSQTLPPKHPNAVATVPDPAPVTTTKTTTTAMTQNQNNETQTQNSFSSDRDELEQINRLLTSDVPEATIASNNATAAAPATATAKRRRFYEYDTANDCFKRARFVNCLQDLPEGDEDSLFVFSLYLKMKKMNEMQKLQFQTSIYRKLEEIQGPERTLTSQSTQSSLTGSQRDTQPSTHGLSEAQLAQINRCIQDVLSRQNNDSSTASTARNDSLTWNGIHDALIRRADLTQALPLIIKDEPLDSASII